jgi:hypothetical protein
MINQVLLEGIVVSTWKYGSDLFVRLASYRDPGQPIKRIDETRDEPDYINVRFTNAAYQGVPFHKGNLLRVDGLLQSREYLESLEEFLQKARKNAPSVPTFEGDPLVLRQVRSGRSAVEILARQFVIQSPKVERGRSRMETNNSMNVEAEPEAVEESQA